MAEENELEKRAVEELLRETDRARVRAETMGPAGWLKCPLRSTNKRFLLNTLRSTDLQRRSDMSAVSHSSNTRERARSETPERRRGRSRSPPTDHRSKGGRTERKHSPPPQSDKRDKHRRLDGDKDEQRRYRGDRDRRRDDGLNRDKERQTL